jgi:HK97 family phage portal protein
MLNPLRWLGRKAVESILSGVSISDPRVMRLFSPGPTHAGEIVNVDTAMQLSAVWSCVTLIAQTIATLPLMIYERDKEDFGTLNRDHPLYPILHDSPNAEMTAVEFWEPMVGAVLLWGNAYAQIIRSGRRVIALIPLRPDRVQTRRNEDGSLTYLYAWMGTSAELSEDEVFHLKGFSLDGIVGISVIAQGRQALATAIAADRASGNFFRNGMRPSGVLTAPTYLTPEQRKRKQEWIDEYSGAINNGRVPLLEGGWKLESLSIPPEDAQLLSSRQFDIEELCRLFHVPPPMIGHTQSATAWGSGLEQMLLWFLQFCLRPQLKRIEARIGKSLIDPGERRTVYAEFNVEGLLRADGKTRATLYATMVDHGLKTRNEIRALENDPPMPGGDDLTVNAALVPLKNLGKQPKPPAPLPGFRPEIGQAQEGGTVAAPGQARTKEGAIP